MHSALFSIAQQFDLLRLEITLQLQADATLPAFKGAMWHGLLGHVLMAHDSRVYHIFYGEHAKQAPKPYAIVPHGDHQQVWRKGQFISFEIKLFGAASGMGQTIVDALNQASDNKHLGVGEQRVPYCLASVASVLPTGKRVGIVPTKLFHWITDLPLEVQNKPTEAALHFQTPVRTKKQGSVQKKEAPDLPFWVNQTLRRLSSLTQFWVLEDACLIDQLYQQTFAMLPNKVVLDSNCYFEDWQRYSLKHDKVLPLGGLKGQVSFYGVLYGILPILKVGELLQVGSKTTCGLGSYEMIY